MATLLPRSAARLQLVDGLKLHEIQGGPQRTVGVVTRREVELPELAAWMLREIRRRSAQLAGAAQVASL